MLMRSCSDISRRCRHTTASNMMKMMANTQRRCCHVAAPTRHEGKIIAWNPIDRRGRIQDNTTGREYIIANTRAFESVLPTTLRSLNGASVSFAVDTRAHAGDRVIVRSRVDPIHAASYTQRPPMDFLRCVEPFAPRKQQEQQHQQQEQTSSSTNATQAETEKHDDVDELYAKDIVIDVSSISNDQLVHASGPHVHQQPIAPPKHLKDLRSCRVLDADTNEFLLMRRQLGSDEAARAAMERQREEKARNAHVREVVMEKVRGVVVAWSPIHRSGVISIKAEDVDGTTNNNSNNNTNNNDLSTTSMEGDHLCIIRHVQSFSSAMPTSNALLHREVSFTKVRYTLPHPTDASSSSSSSSLTRFFAEDIVLSGDVTFDASTSSAEEAHQLKMTEQREERARRSLGANFFADAVDDARFLGAEDVVPDDGLVGVITRWSGGQGTIESSGGKLFYIRSAADFVELVDAQSSSIRGAVVRFYPHDDDRRHAHTIDIISHASFKPSSSSSASITWMGKYNNVSIKKRLMDEDRARTSTSKDDDADHTEEADVKYDYGMLLSWSAVEGQGIIHGEDGQRFVLRDASRHVVDFERRKGAMCNGRKVQFVRDGASGKLATRVVVLESEAEEEERVAEELQPRNNNNNNMSLDGHTDEAIASPECASYWISRAEKSGFDLSEVKALQNRALTMDDGAEVGSDGEDKLLDSEDIIKKDHWWNDPRKNIRFPNSDFTAGHLALVGPASMMNVAMKAKDPQRLDKMAKKYQAKLTEAQREKAWAMAKEMAPKYEDCIKRARDKNEEPSFYFY